MIDQDKASAPPADDQEHVLLGNAVQRVGRTLFGHAWKDDVEGELWNETVALIGRALRAGHLEGYHSWLSLMSIRRDDWRLNEDDLAKICRSSKSPLFHTLAPGGSGEWVFVGRRGLDALIFGITGPSPGRSAPFAFSMEDQKWRLYDAAVWIATGGTPTTTAAISDGSLEEVGCRLLFPKLAELGYRAPKITGLGYGELRSNVMSALWERAHTGWLGTGVGHLVRFFPDPDGSDNVSSDLTTSRGLTTTWWDLRIGRDDLFALFPARELREQEPLSSAPPHPRQAEFDMMLGLMEGETGETAKNAARIVSSARGDPESFDALYAAFRRKYPASVRPYYRD